MKGVWSLKGLGEKDVKSKWRQKIVAMMLMLAALQPLLSPLISKFSLPT